MTGSHLSVLKSSNYSLVAALDRVVIFVTGESGIVEKDPAKGVPDFVLKILVQKMK